MESLLNKGCLASLIYFLCIPDATVLASKHAFDLSYSPINFFFEEAQTNFALSLKREGFGIFQEFLHLTVKQREFRLYATHFIILSDWSQMSQSYLQSPEANALSANRSIHLSKNNQAKNQLYRKIDIYLSELQSQEGSEAKIELLKLRKKLIEKYGLSVERIENLERIFLHYCSHIFKTGKHMTFQRLEYEKNHLTMDRFFVFLKDFGLTAAVIDGVSREIVDKSELVLIFKKISINCKDLNFEQFISCIQRIAIVYYDAKVTYRQRQLKLARERQKRKENYIKSMKRRQAAIEAARNKLEGSDKDQDEVEKLINNQDQNEQQNQIEIHQQEKLQGENDRLVEELMNSSKVQHLEQELKTDQLHYVHSSEQLNAENNSSFEPSIIKDEGFNRFELLVLTPQEKIEYFYELIDVDNSVSFKKKMRELNLPLFQTKSHRRATSHAENNPPTVKNKEFKATEITAEQQKRLEELRIIMEEKKERDRSSVPHMTKEDYEQRRKKRMNEEQQVLVKRLPRQKKIQVSELQTDLSSLSKMEFDKINFRKFNPQKLYQPSEQDDAYLEEYYSARRPQRSEKRILSTLETTDKNSQALLQKLKKRAQEIESRERMQQSKYVINQEVNSSTEHQLRKNRLLEKLIKLQKG